MARDSFMITQSMTDLRHGDIVMVRRSSPDGESVTYRTVMYYKAGWLFDQEGKPLVQNQRLCAGIEILEHTPYEAGNSLNRIWLELDKRPPAHSFIATDEINIDGIEVRRKSDGIELSIIHSLGPVAKIKIDSDMADQLGLILFNNASLLRNAG